MCFFLCRVIFKLHQERIYIFFLNPEASLLNPSFSSILNINSLFRGPSVMGSNKNGNEKLGALNQNGNVEEEEDLNQNGNVDEEKLDLQIKGIQMILMFQLSLYVWQR